MPRGEPTITVKYSCTGCGLYRVPVEVPARTDEQVTYWVEKVMAFAISIDHDRRSPFCSSKTMSEVVIPMTGSRQVGGPAEN